MPLVVGDFVREKGFITKLIGVINRPASYLEDALGFRAGRLKQGWMLLALKEEVAPEDFAFAGYTQSSAGETLARTPSGAELRTRIDTVARAGSTDADARAGTGYDMLKRRVAEGFALSGPERIVKVVPHMPHMSAVPPDEQYPPGAGLPQWVLLEQKLFVVAAVVGPGERHGGGGGADFPVSARWVDPALAKTI